MTISGDGLDTATSVDFDGTTFYLADSSGATANPTAPTFTYDSTTGDIALTTPAGTAGAQNVTVTNPGGTSAPLTYTYVAAPSNLALSPDEGPTAGGQSVTISGDDLGGATAVTFDGTTYYPSTDTSAPTGAPTFTQDATNGDITLSTPAGSAGPANVTVTAVGGTSAPATYTYVAAPTSLAISPSSGPLAGGQTVTLSGDNLGSASSVDFNGTTYYLQDSADATANPSAPTFTQDSSTGDITLTTPAGTAAGAVNVTVTTAGGTSDPVQYTYVAGPAIASVTPDSGPVGGGQSVTISGSDLGGATTVDFNGTTYYPAGDTSAPAGSPTFTQNPTTGDITLTTPAGTAGPATITVTTPGGTSPSFPYTYLGVPAASSITPNVGPLAGGQTVTISGTDLGGATSVDFGGTTYYLAGSPDALANTSAPTYTQDATSGDITLATPAATTAGPVNVTVTTPGGTSAPLTYTYAPLPAVTGISPNDGPLAGNTPVTISGPTNCGATTVLFGTTTYYLADSSDAAANPTAPTFTQDATTCAISLSTPASGTAGPVNVIVSTPGGQSPAVAYTYVAAPSALAISPAAGPVVGGQSVSISGDGLDSATTVDFNGTEFYLADSSEASANPLSPTFTYSSTTGDITLTTPAGSGPGDVDVTVTNPGGTSSPLTYTYVAAPGTLSLSPTSGPQTGGTSVTLSGTNLTAATSVDFGGVTYYPQGDTSAPSGAPTFTQAVNGDITLTTQSTPTAGPVSVSVTTAGGTSPNATYTFTVPVPAITGISPSSGPLAGGTPVTISGPNNCGATQVEFGTTTYYLADSAGATANPSAPTFTQNATTCAITLDTPATGTAGPVNVTVTTPGGTSSPATFTYSNTPTLTGSASISGTPRVGSTLVGEPTGWTSGATLTYKWTLPNGTVIGTGQTLVVPSSAAGEKVTLTVTGTKSGYTSHSATASVNVPKPTSPKTIRISGPDRYATAVAIAKNSFPVAGSAKVVFVATGQNFPDALSAGPAAAKLDGPLLLTQTNSLTSETASEIKFLKPAKVIVVGEHEAVSNGVFDALEKIVPNTVRWGGADRYATSLIISKNAFGTTNVPSAFVATGVTYPDALSASAFAGSHNMPVLLVNGKGSTLPSGLAGYLKGAKTTTVKIAGGTSAVTPALANQLKAASGKTPTRYAGADRYQTSIAINKEFTTGPLAYLATGANFPDALSGAAAAAHTGAPLYVVQPGCVPAGVLSQFTAWNTGTVYVLGGTAALSNAIMDLKSCG